MREPQPRSALSIAHLSHYVLIQILRAHLDRAGGEATGWLAALSDAQITRAMAAMHVDPARFWTVDALALAAGLSRTTFAVRFREVVGQTPMEYLTRWRMLCAADRLRRSTTPISRIAAEVGYSSESAFTAAFRRVMDITPRRYARQGDTSDDPAPKKWMGSGRHAFHVCR